MTRRLVVVGAAGFGRETLDVVHAHNRARAQEPFDVVGVLDDAPSAENLQRLAARGIAHLGAIRDYVATHPPTPYLLAIGAPRVRELLVRLLDDAGWTAACLVHPAASVGTTPAWRDGVVVCGGAQVSTNVSLGRHAHINPNATIGHDSVLEDFVSVNPAAIISGEVRLRSGVLVGAGATVLQGLSVGARSVIGAGAVVTKDVPADVVVKGVPGVWV